ncbi:MAG: hypothetical protein L0Y68_04870 [Candidatus Dadabacteria bacterium]|nr:hypothetical protein [Candidatus Dadabacteria bacterium]
MKCTKVVEAFVLGVMGMRKRIGLPVLFLMAVVVLTFGAITPVVSALEFSEAELFFELNDTDGDLGIHASIDGGPYSKLEIEDPNERVILLLKAQGKLALQGLTQFFMESAEPSFDELEPEVFFNRFPEGRYEISAIALEGGELESVVRLSHVLAAPVGNVMVNTEPAAENCDADPLPSVSEPVTIDWDPVTQSHPEIGKSGPIKIVRYQFFVEQGDIKFAVDLPPDATEFEVPSEIFALGDTNEPFKFEIIARTATNNNTAIESCLIVQ